MTMLWGVGGGEMMKATKNTTAGHCTLTKTVSQTTHDGHKKGYVSMAFDWNKIPFDVTW